MKVLIALVTIGLVSACSVSDSPKSQTKYDSESSIPLNGSISEGKIIAPSKKTSTIKSYISEQMLYTMGQFNQFDGVADLNRTEVSLTNVVPSETRPGWFDVTYKASLFVSWSKSTSIPKKLELVMPLDNSSEGISGFMATYAQACRDDFSHPPEAGNFWYYYRPLAQGCALADPGHVFDSKLVAKFDMTFSPSKEQTNGKSPEYGKVWEDNALVVTAIFGKNEPEADPKQDAGTYAFNELYSDLVGAFGLPVSSVPEGLGRSSPGPKLDRVEIVFNTPNGKLDVGLMLVDGIRTMNQPQTDFYNRRSSNSDFVSYNGHSGLGANIRALAKLGAFVPNQYQLFFVNGCDTFAYVDNSLRDAHQSLNPNFGPNKYFDLITNSMPSYFSSNADGNFTIIKGLLGKKATYREILANIDFAQKAVVTGEQDNTWPKPF